MATIKAANPLNAYMGDSIENAIRAAEAARAIAKDIYAITTVGASEMQSIGIVGKLVSKLKPSALSLFLRRKETIGDASEHVNLYIEVTLTHLNALREYAGQDYEPTVTKAFKGIPLWIATFVIGSLLHGLVVDRLYDREISNAKTKISQIKIDISNAYGQMLQTYNLAKKEPNFIDYLKKNKRVKIFIDKSIEELSVIINEKIPSLEDRLDF